ncbi:c-type cytochrome [Thioalkalivibrio sp. XN8]|uniref:c-type cytochrome n=1 Tax=Thioalkalivibrio sp. XN8 TaxID=2712863 RepID=UPI0013EC7439|nr:c-type cytochrome [Thioalkalivibrio sp. XN8]NGP54393.1 c-type cytochrome [Thioalkalivibrio sp. XN8]
MKSPAIAVATLIGLLALAGCGRSEQVPVELGAPGQIPPSAQRAGDPALGYEILVNRGYVSCGVPRAAFERAAAEAPATRRFELPGRDEHNAGLPYQLNAATTADGVELVVSNCLACHGGEFNGELVVGLGDAFADFTTSPMAGIERLGLLVEDGAEAAAWRRWADRIGAIAPYMVTDTVGVNPAPNLTMALMAYRDPDTLAWHGEPRLEPPPYEPLPTAVPPWWRMQKKHAMFYHGGGRGDHVHYMMLKSLVCTDEVEEAREIDGWFTHVRAYISSLQPPAWPFALDEALAAEGRVVFERQCAACHGTYGENETYPNLVIGLEEVGTDPAYALQAVEAERFIRWFNGSFYGQGAQAMPAPGYVAPPLDGVWATAPYLHNDSVPSLAALLDSNRRPTYWRHRTGPREYDPAALGWAYDALDRGKEGAADPAAARYIYDTTRRGYGNYGHTFGDALTERERAAVLEYLKTL